VKEASAVATPQETMGSSPASAELERLWLAVLQKLAATVAHELRNALNGVAVNLEVVRSRASREGVAASALGSFAGSAADQLEHVIAITDALMSLSREQEGAAVVGRTTDHIASLVRPPLAAAGGSLDVVVEGEGATRVPARAARLFIAAALQRAVEASAGAGAALRCRVRPAAGAEVCVEGSFMTAPRLDDGVNALAQMHGVAIRATESSITLTFPA
jgi:signal transduction histidine kinase